MKLAQSLQSHELSNVVLESVKDLTEQMIDELCQKYNTQLAKNGRRLTEGDIKRLKPYLRTDMLKVNMSISCSITPKLLEDIEMYPISSKQTVFEENSETKESTFVEMVDSGYSRDVKPILIPKDQKEVMDEAEELIAQMDEQIEQQKKTAEVGPITLDELGELNDKLTEENKFREERIKRASGVDN